MQLKSIGEVSTALKLIGDSEQTIEKVTIAINGLSKANAISVITSTSLTQAEKMQMLASIGCTEEEIKQALATSALAESEGVATASTLTLGTATKSLGTALKGLAAAHPLLLAITAIVGVVSVAKKVYNHFNVTIKEANDVMDEAVSTYETTKSELENINSELDANKQKIDELLSKDKLTYAEKGQLEELQEITKELEFQADIEQRKLENDQKNAANKAVQAYEKQYGNDDITDDNIQEKVKFAKNTGNIGVSKGDNDIAGNVAELQIFKSLLEDTENELKNASGMTDDEINSLNEDFQAYVDIISDTEDKLNSSLSDLESKRSAMEDQYKAAIDKKNSGALLSTDDKNIISTYEEILNAIELIYKYLDPNKYRDMQMSSIFDTEGIEKSKDELIEMAKAGKLDESTINGYKNLKTAMDENGVSAKDLCDDIYALADAEKTTSDAANKTSVSSFEDIWNSADFSDAKDKLLELAKSGEITPKTIESTTEYKKLIDETGLSAQEVTNNITSMLSVQEKLSAANQGLDKLKSSYEEFKNIGFVTAQALESLPDAFKTLPDFNVFEKIVGNPESGKEKIQQAFNDIVKSYLLEQNTLSGLVNASNSEVQTYIANLKQMGITNAEEIVTQTQQALSNENKLINDAESEYEKAHLDYVNGKAKMDANYLTKTASKNGQLASALGSAYKQDYDNWCELLSQKAEAYNEFVDALNKSGISYDSNLTARGNADKFVSQGGHGANEIAEMYTQAAEADRTNYEYEKAKQKLKLDYSQIKVDFSSNYSPSSGSSKSKGSGSGGSSKAKETAQQFDFLEVRINKLTKSLEKTKDKIDEIFNVKAKNSQIDKTIKKTTELIKAETQAAKRYQQEANKVAKNAQKTHKETVTTSNNTGQQVVNSAKKYVGKLNYVWGGASLTNGADCSGFTQQIYKQYGINLAHNAQTQYDSTKGTKINSAKNLKAGDLVFFGSNLKSIHHVGIYAGNGKFIDSPTTGKKVSTHNLLSRKDFVGAVRPDKLTSGSSSKTKTTTVKGLSKNTVNKYIKLIENGSLGKDAIQKIKNETLKSFVQEYKDWYDKSQTHKENAEQYRKDVKQYKIDKYQNLADDAQARIEKSQAWNELYAGNYKEQNKHIEYQKKQLKTSYDYQIKIAKKNKDDVEVSRLKAEYQKELNDLTQQEFDNISNTYDKKLEQVKNKSDFLNTQISGIESKGYVVSENMYQSMMQNEQKNIPLLDDKLDELRKKRDEAVADGTVKKGTDAWYEMQNEIWATKTAIEESKNALAEYENQIRQLKWDAFDRQEDFISQIQDESNFLVDMMSNKDLYDDNGNWTDYANATAGLRAVNYNAYMAQADDYEKEIKSLQEQIDNDPYNLTLIQRKQDLIKTQRDLIKSANDEQEAIKSLVSDGYNKWLDALQKAIDKRKEELDQTSNLYEYEKKIAEQTRAVSSLEKQKLALQGNDTEEAKAKIQKINVDLQNAKDDLAESEYEQWKQDQTKMLDKLADDAQEWISNRLSDTDSLISDVIDITNQNGSTIKKTLEKVTSDVGTSLSSDMKNIWTGANGISSIVTTYGDGFDTEITTVNSTLSDIKEYVASISNNPQNGGDDDKTDTDNDGSGSGGTALENPPKTSGSTNKTATPGQVLDTAAKVINSVVPGIGVGEIVANTAKLAAATSFINKHKDKPKQKKSYYASLNRYLYDKVGGVLSKAEEIELAKMLNVKLTTKDLTGDKGKKDIDNILKALKKIGFAKGGTIGKAVKQSGEDGFILARTGEEVLSLEKIKELGKSFQMINPVLNNVKTMIPDSQIVQRQNFGGNNIDKVQMEINLPNVTNYEEFKSELVKDKQFEKVVQSMTFGNALGKNSLSKYKI